MAAVVLACFLGALLFANVAQVVKHRHTVWEMRRRHIMSLHRIDTGVKMGLGGSELTALINQEVDKA